MLPRWINSVREGDQSQRSAFNPRPKRYLDGEVLNGVYQSGEEIIRIIALAIEVSACRARLVNDVPVCDA